MLEETSPQPNAERKEVVDFLKEYSVALDRAKISEEHTATQGWQDLYGERIEVERKQRDRLSDRLQGFAETIRQRLFDEDEEKAIADLKKQATELRELETYWRAQIVDPIIAPLHECARVIEMYRSLVRNAVASSPLHTRGLLQAMDDAIESVPKVRFMTASGRMIVDNPV